MTPLILAANAGSSSLKFALFKKNEADQPFAEAAGQVEGIGTRPRFTVKNAAEQTLVDRAHDVDDVPHHGGAIAVIRSWLHEHDQGAKLLAVGHRVVHGGQRFSEPILVDPKVLTELEALVPLAPLYQPHSVAVIRAVQDAMPTLPQIACFDTAFHVAQPDVAQAFALPRHLTAEGVRRYGFHGLSYEYIASALPALRPELGSLAAALGGLDALVFTGGIGERSAVIRAQICRQAAWLGLELDAAANERHGPCLSTPASKVTAWLLPTDEDLIIARHTLAWVTRSPESGGLAQG